MTKLPKDAVNYREATSGRQCGTCNMYHDHACDLVAGDISPGDVCDRWQPRDTQARQSAAWDALAGAR